METYGKPVYKEIETNAYYEDALSYHAMEVKKTSSKVNQTLENLYDEISTDLANFKDSIENLSISFGKEFITINHKSLDFVDVDAFLAIITNINRIMEEEKETASTFFKSLNRDIYRINSELELLQERAEEYKALKEKLTLLEESSNYSERDVEQIQKIKQELLNFKPLKGTPIPTYGDWIKG